MGQSVDKTEIRTESIDVAIEVLIPATINLQIELTHDSGYLQKDSDIVRVLEKDEHLIKALIRRAGESDMLLDYGRTEYEKTDIVDRGIDIDTSVPFYKIRHTDDELTIKKVTVE